MTSKANSAGGGFLSSTTSSSPSYRRTKAARPPPNRAPPKIPHHHTTTTTTRVMEEESSGDDSEGGYVSFVIHDDRMGNSQTSDVAINHRSSSSFNQKKPRRTLTAKTVVPSCWIPALTVFNLICLIVLGIVVLVHYSSSSNESGGGVKRGNVVVVGVETPITTTPTQTTIPPHLVEAPVKWHSVPFTLIAETVHRHGQYMSLSMKPYWEQLGQYQDDADTNAGTVSSLHVCCKLRGTFGCHDERVSVELSLEQKLVRIHILNPESVGASCRLIWNVIPPSSS